MAQRRKLAVRNMIIATAMTTLSTLTVTKSASAIECVIYARQVSDFTIRGDAWTWWGQAQQVGYTTGRAPQSGSAIVFKRTAGMRRGHVGLVRKVVSSREVVIDHANWSGGRIDRNVSVIDVSPRNDWSQVRVWYPRINDYGNTIYPVYGFIYDRHGKSPTVEASYQAPVEQNNHADRDLVAISAPAEHPMLSDRFGVSVLMRDGKKVVMGHPVISNGDRGVTPAVARDDTENMRRSTKETDTPVVLASFDRTAVKLPVMPTLRPMTKVSLTEATSSTPESVSQKAQDKSVVDRDPGLFGSILSGLKVKPGSQLDKVDNGVGPVAAIEPVTTTPAAPAEAVSHDGAGMPVMPTRRPGSN